MTQWWVTKPHCTISCVEEPSSSSQSRAQELIVGTSAGGWAEPCMIQPRLSALSKILSYNQRVCYSPFYWWQPLIQETQRGQLHSAKLGRCTLAVSSTLSGQRVSGHQSGKVISRLSTCTALIVIKKEKQKKQNQHFLISFLKLLRNIRAECRAMKDLLYCTW